MKRVGFESGRGNVEAANSTNSAMAARYGLASKAEAASCSFKHEFDFDRLIRKLDLA
jgi:hypothetical protein